MKTLYLWVVMLLPAIINAQSLPEPVNTIPPDTSFYMTEVVISGTRTAKRRIDNAVAVNVLTANTFRITQSNTLSEGICFQPGLRMETDCQTCNYTQLRMNGLAGNYSQILIDSRPVFTSLMSLYSLEQIPATQVEKVEVVRGGGSVLFGANAIAGTVNIITREPRKNEWSFSSNSALIDGRTPDHFLNGNLSLVNEKQTAGMSVFTSHRYRDHYDANGDEFSEIPRLENHSIGTKIYFKPRPGHKIGLNAWRIYEFRRGGNKFELPADQADQSEERVHHISVGGMDYSFTPAHKPFWINAYVSFQHTTRLHYTGIDQSDGWGNTRSHTLVGGVQYNHRIKIGQSENTLTTGLEHQYDYTFDEIPGYNYLIDQSTHLTASFLQSDWAFSRKLTLLSGVRMNVHNFVDHPVFTPRLSLLFKPVYNIQLRTGYAKGFKAPQAFETDLHIAFAGGGISRVQIAEDLREETSDSFSFSADYNNPQPDYIYGFTAEVFYTRLYNTFVLEEIGTDAAGNQRLLRKNGGNSTVKGITLEGRLNYDQMVQVETGFTLQSSLYDNPIAWSNEVPGIRNYLRTPNAYGFFTLSILPESRLSGSLSGVYTGTMKVPHFAGAPGVENDRVIDSPQFFEINSRINYRILTGKKGPGLEISGGVQNIFNSYQRDFDTGPYRDSNYVYGPSRPRTFFLGLKIAKGNTER
ncbi:MAG: TonB-dependent receptor [Bacteroidia bacterium]